LKYDFLLDNTLEPFPYKGTYKPQYFHTSKDFVEEKKHTVKDFSIRIISSQFSDGTSNKEMTCQLILINLEDSTAYFLDRERDQFMKFAKDSV
jgi:hypothetical protein